ncbi:S-methyl-5'-thioadenosine phosphorylase [Mycobacterium persicum]|uniref:S-methyl-5'-thioadenosine phosphorylase n=2 Tax=Mycobacterium persicum TaxID=1487726 RepID=A0AB38UN14_9MYCO|nr:S-methyl-5'-thioadenosine phosphorylase [Mycobacterium persicum]
MSRTRDQLPGIDNNERMLAVIGGTGFYTFFGPDARTVEPETPYGRPSGAITIGAVGGHDVAFLPRHGVHHQYSAHTVPYRANMWALRALGVRRVFAPCSVGSLTSRLGPGAVVVPDQLVDRTRGRADTYFDSGGVHATFADPYCPTLRGAVTGLPDVVDGGTLVVIQGPRFSTRAESQWFAAAGFNLVNMTGYPEAILARELELCYAAIALVTDVDAGIDVGKGVKASDVFASFGENIEMLKELVRASIGRVAGERTCTLCLLHAGVALPFELP